MFKKTDLFEGSVKPVHIGVYLRPDMYFVFSYWNGKFWRVGSSTVEGAYRSKNGNSASQKSPWRGLAENPLAVADLRSV